MRETAKAFSLVPAVLMLSACMALPSPAPALPEPSSTPTASPTPTGPTPQQQNLTRACDDLDASLDLLLDAIGADVVPTPTFEQYVAAVQTFAYALGDQSVAAGDTGDVPLGTQLLTASQAAAALVDEMNATGLAPSTGTYLAFRTNVQAAADSCNLSISFA